MKFRFQKYQMLTIKVMVNKNKEVKVVNFIDCKIKIILNSKIVIVKNNQL